MNDFDVTSLVRENIRGLAPYRSARHDHQQGVLLDANENPYSNGIDPDGLSLNRYPDPMQRELRTRLAEINNIPVDMIFAGVGSDEVIDLLIRIFAEPGRDSIAAAEPTYGMYRVAAQVNNIAVKRWLLDDTFGLNMATFDASIDATTRMVFCCSPNNPTANLLQRDDVRDLCERFPGIVLLDEAYIDFAYSGTMIDMVAKYPNLVILRTLSKGWALAGIRLGYAVASPDVISWLFKVKPPYNINSLTSHYALLALERMEEHTRTIEIILQERERLAERLMGISSVEEIYPSDANFLLVRFRDASNLCKAIAERGVIVRDRSSEVLLENCLRITVGTPSENDLLIGILQELAQ